MLGRRLRVAAEEEGVVLSAVLVSAGRLTLVGADVVFDLVA